MKRAQTINATKARNDFFNLLEDSYLNQRSFLVKKGNIPMAYLVPTSVIVEQRNKQLALLGKIKEMRNSMKKGSESVELLKEIRQDGE